MNREVKSILTDEIMNRFFGATNLDELKQDAINVFKSSKINDKDKHVALIKISQQTSLVALQTYLFNSRSKYNGLSVIKTGNKYV